MYRAIPVSMLVLVLSSCGSPESASDYDLVLRGGRVIDPESGLDAVRNVGIRDGRIEAITEEALEGARVLEATGLVVAPGFIDLHVHGQTMSGRGGRPGGPTERRSARVGGSARGRCRPS